MRDLKTLNSVKIYNKDYNIFNYEGFISAEKLYKIAQDNPAGFTIDKKCNYINYGYSVGVKQTQNSIGYCGAIKVVNFVKDYSILCLGGWLNSQDNEYYFDAVVIFHTLQSAIDYGKSQQQIAIYDLTNKKEIIL